MISKGNRPRAAWRDWSHASAAFQDPDLACLFVRPGNDRANLTTREATQIETVLWRIYKVHEELHYLHEQDMIDESVWQGFRQLLVIEAGYESYRTWWYGYHRTFSPRFREFMEEIMSTTSVNSEAYFLNMDCDTPVGEDYWRPY